VRQTGTKQIAFMVQKYLRFVNQTPKCRAVNDAVTVALKLAARGRRRL
jgi:Holliday junction resolvasome RuvABC endonuclease subunit